MVIGAARFELHLLDEPNSLKGKRHIVRSLKDRIRHRLDVSAAEVGDLQLWQKAVLGVAFAAADSGIAEKLMSRVRSMIGNDPAVEVVREDVELIDF
jgi:uncharacterized protein YlxP (DUF503 family)